LKKLLFESFSHLNSPANQASQTLQTNQKPPLSQQKREHQNQHLKKHDMVRHKRREIKKIKKE
jgi:hypothetical protein